MATSGTAAAATAAAAANITRGDPLSVSSTSSKKPLSVCELNKIFSLRWKTLLMLVKKASIEKCLIIFIEFVLNQQVLSL